MAGVTNQVSTLNSIGNREDLSDLIFRVAPEETPFFSNIGSDKATATYTEWQTESLATPSASNAQFEGNVFTISAGNLTSRVGNYCQIVTKTFAVSKTEEVVKKAGRTSEVNRQKLLKGIEGRRDFEMSIIGNNPSAAEIAGTSARTTGGALAWITTNTSSGAGGSAGGFSSGVVSAATNGTLRTLTETLVKAAMATAFQNGAKISQAYMGPTQKQEWSAFTGIATIRKDAPGDKMATIIGAADIYVSDFGNLQLIPHPYALTRDVLGIDPKMCAKATLRGWDTTELAETADADQYALVYEAAFKMRNQKGAFAIRDLQ